MMEDTIMDRVGKIQCLLMTHLMEKGYIELKLPDGMVLELGIVQEDKHGKMVKTDGYSWLIATQKEREVFMDSYNLGLRYVDEDGKIVIEDNMERKDGQPIRELVAV
jgi:hypothetical protein